MVDSYATIAIQSVLNSSQSYCKFLSANDSGATGAHQSGILISKNALPMMFSQPLEGGVVKRTVRIQWQNDFWTDSCFTYYGSKNELRLTRFGKGFPLLIPERTGSLFVFTKQSDDCFQGFILDTEDEIEQFLSAFGLSPADTNQMIDRAGVVPETQEQLAIQSFIQSLNVDFPTSEIMSSAARDIQNKVYNRVELVKTNPDQKLIDWTKTEFSLFRAIEYARYGDAISHGFTSVDSFIELAQTVLNRRKSRAGKSLEHHLAAIFDANSIKYGSQAITEGKKKPDFLFPSESDYHTPTFPTNKLISLAAKTTCKDRWRQILNEADRLKDSPKYLCTLQRGISPTQMDEMESEKVILVVPKPYISAYPKDRQDRIWTISKFVSYVKEIENT